jgi:hypothetical protein
MAARELDKYRATYLGLGKSLASPSAQSQYAKEVHMVCYKLCIFCMCMDLHDCEVCASCSDFELLRFPANAGDTKA